MTSNDILKMGPLTKDAQGKIVRKPKCKLAGEDGNIFNLVGIAQGALNKAGMKTEAKELGSRVWGAQSYDEALSMICEYVDAQ